MTYLVTGGTGLIGSRIVRDLVKEDEEVIIYDWIPDTSILKTLLTQDEILERVKIISGDITDLPLLINSIKKNNIDKIIHTASLLVLDSNSNPLKALKVNCEGTICVFEAGKMEGVKKIVWSSSNSIFGPAEKYKEDFILNNAPHYPQNIYGATKSFNERISNYYFNEFGIDIIGIRYMHVYGSGQKRGFFGSLVKELVLNPSLGKPGRVTHSDAMIGWSYVDDPARATVMASKAKTNKTRSYSIMGDVRSVKDVVEYVKKILPNADITCLPGTFTGDPVKLDTNLIEEEIGYIPEWSMEQGIKETINITRKQNGLAII